MSDYRVQVKQERWVETIIYDVENPEEALNILNSYDDWTEAGYANNKGDYLVFDHENEELVAEGWSIDLTKMGLEMEVN